MTCSDEPASRYKMGEFVSCDPYEKWDIGDDTVVGNFCSLRNVVVGKKCIIWNYVNLYDCTIGDETRIGSFTEIGGSKVGKRCAIQARVFVPPGVTIGDLVFLGPGVIFTNEKHPRVKVKGDPPFRPEKTKVQEGAIIGAGAVILPGINIGAHAMVGAGAVVTKSVQAGQTVVGNPARPLGKFRR